MEEKNFLFNEKHVDIINKAMHEAANECMLKGILPVPENTVKIQRVMFEKSIELAEKENIKVDYLHMLAEAGFMMLSKMIAENLYDNDLKELEKKLKILDDIANAQS